MSNADSCKSISSCVAWNCLQVLVVYHEWVSAILILIKEDLFYFAFILRQLMKSFRHYCTVLRLQTFYVFFKHHTTLTTVTNENKNKLENKIFKLDILVKIQDKNEACSMDNDITIISKLSRGNFSGRSGSTRGIVQSLCKQSSLFYALTHREMWNEFATFHKTVPLALFNSTLDLPPRIASHVQPLCQNFLGRTSFCIARFCPIQKVSNSETQIYASISYRSVRCTN